MRAERIIEAFVDTYTIPAMEEISSHALGAGSYLDDSVVKDFIMTQEEVDNSEPLTTHWIGDAYLLEGVVIDGTVICFDA